MRVGSKHYAIHIPLENNQFIFVVCDTFFCTIGTNPYILLHVLLLRVRFAHDSFPSESNASDTINADSLYFSSFYLFSLICFLRRFLKKGFIHELAKIAASESPIATNSD